MANFSVKPMSLRKFHYSTYSSETQRRCALKAAVLSPYGYTGTRNRLLEVMDHNAANPKVLRAMEADLEWLEKTYEEPVIQPLVNQVSHLNKVVVHKMKFDEVKAKMSEMTETIRSLVLQINAMNESVAALQV